MNIFTADQKEFCINEIMKSISKINNMWILSLIFYFIKSYTENGANN